MIRPSLRALVLASLAVCWPVPPARAEVEMRYCNPFVMADTETPPATHGDSTAALMSPTSDRTVIAAALDATTVWHPLTPDPIGFSRPTMIVDPLRRRLVVFGGAGWAGYLSSVFVRPLDRSGRWSELVIAGPRPASKVSGGAVYDPVRDRMIVFGGVLTDGVWALSLGDSPTWTRLADPGSGPGDRQGVGVIYDPVGDRMITFGGISPPFQNDVWALTLGAQPQWTQLQPAGIPPSPRNNYGIAYDPVRQRILVFSGETNDGWEPIGTPARVWALDLGDLAWSTVETTGNAPPELRDSGVSFDPVHDRLVVYGGRSADPAGLRGTWVLQFGDTPVWTKLQTSQQPRSTADARLAYDAQDDRFFLFGGDWGSDLWTLGLAADPQWTAWEFGDPFPGYTRYAGTGVWDAIRHRTWLFGGQSAYVLHGFRRTIARDLRAIRTDDHTHWSEADTVAYAPPGGGVGMAIDEQGDRLIVFGGDDTPGFQDWGWGQFSSRLHQHPLKMDRDWSELPVAGGTPPARMYAPIVYDPVRRQMILFGGMDALGARGDTWILALDDGAPHWTRLDSTETAPPARFGQSMTYDPVGDRIVLIGGLGAADAFADGWQLGLEDRRWAPLDAADLPIARSFASTVYDSKRQRLVVFGGRDGDGRAVRDTWLLPLAPGAQWTLADSGASAPGSRWGAPAVYDADRDRVDVFFGAYDPCTGEWLRQMQNDSWSMESLDPVPPRPSSLPSHSEPGRVVVRWDAHGITLGGEFHGAVQRRTEGAAWQTIGKASDGSGGVVEFVDAGAAPQAHYQYRLLYYSSRVATVSDMVDIRVPRANLALWRASASPARDGIELGVSLSDASPARVDVLDVLGRRLASREVGSLGAGDHVVRLTAPGELAPGIYLARLTASGLSRIAKVSVLH